MAVRPVKAKSNSTGAVPPPTSPAKPAKAPAKPAKATAQPAKAPTKPAKAPTKPAKAPTKPAKATAKSAKATAGLTSIRFHCNVGLGNRITVRGDTDPFRWDGGIDALNTADDVWEFQIKGIPAGQTFQFKPLINDTTYSTGDNYVGAGVMNTLDIYPAF